MQIFLFDLFLDLQYKSLKRLRCFTYLIKKQLMQINY